MRPAGRVGALFYIELLPPSNYTRSFQNAPAPGFPLNNNLSRDTLLYCRHMRNYTDKFSFLL